MSTIWCNNAFQSKCQCLRNKNASTPAPVWWSVYGGEMWREPHYERQMGPSWFGFAVPLKTSTRGLWQRGTTCISQRVVPRAHARRTYLQSIGANISLVLLDALCFVCGSAERRVSNTMLTNAMLTLRLTKKQSSAKSEKNCVNSELHYTAVSVTQIFAAAHLPVKNIEFSCLHLKPVLAGRRARKD